MNDSEFAKFFETIKKFEHLFNEAIYNSDDFKSKNNEEKINTLLELINDKKLYTGTIADGKVNLSEYTIGAYILSLIIVDSDNFYSKLNQLNDETLQEANYSREEITQGLHDIMQRFGIQLELS